MDRPIWLPPVSPRFRGPARRKPGGDGGLSSGITNVVTVTNLRSGKTSGQKEPEATRLRSPHPDHGC